MNKPSLPLSALLTIVLPLYAVAANVAAEHAAPYRPAASRQTRSAPEVVLPPKVSESAAVVPITALSPLSGKANAQVSTPITLNPLWEVKPMDSTLQRLFARWAKQVGWTTIWDADQDIPLVATARFAGSFTDAVQDVLRTTESTDTPLHPCFYTNHVMRVVPLSTVCDPAKD